jgi:hypothetical protein
MAIMTMYDYLPSLTADYVTTTFSVDPQQVMTVGGEKDIIVNKGYGVTEERVILSTQSRFQVKLQWQVLGDVDHSTLFEFYHDPAKGCAIARSFYWTPPTQYLAANHDLTVRFDCRWESFLQNYKNYGIASLLLAVLGRKAE